MELHAVKHDYKAALWCGPAALSAITGKSTKVCRDAVRKVYEVKQGCKRAPIKGVKNWEMCDALRLLGYRVMEVDTFYAPMLSRPTLARYLRRRKGITTTATLLINVTRHYVVVRGRKFVDNTQPNPVFIGAAKGRRKRVRFVWMIDKPTKKTTGRKINEN